MNSQRFIFYLALEGDRTTKKKTSAFQMASGMYIVILVALLAIIGIIIFLAYLHRRRNCLSDFHIITNRKIINRIPSKMFLNLHVLIRIRPDLIYRKGKKEVNATVRNPWAYG